MHGADRWTYFPVPSLLKWWTQLETAMDLSAEMFESISKQLKNNTQQWL